MTMVIGGYLWYVAANFQQLRVWQGWLHKNDGCSVKTWRLFKEHEGDATGHEGDDQGHEGDAKEYKGDATDIQGWSKDGWWLFHRAAVLLL